MDCAGGTLISTKKLERVLSKVQKRKGSPGQITADVLKALPPECVEKLARSLSVMCWDMNFPEEWLCSFAVVAPKVVGATCVSKFRPIAALCAKNPGHTVAQITPFTATQECAVGVCAENLRRCWLVLVAASGRTITINCDGAAGCEKRHSTTKTIVQLSRQRDYKV